jgi:hypothetical protein
MNPGRRMLLGALGLAGLLAYAPAARSEDLPEYRLKAAFVYNFIVYTEWPAATGNALNLCVHGTDPFGREIDGLQGKVASGRTLAVLRKAAGEPLKDCQVVFVSASSIDGLPRLLDGLRGHPVLTVADSPGAMRQGVMLNMNMAQGKVTFEANLLAARSAGLDLSSKLLRLATEVRQ